MPDILLGGAPMLGMRYGVKEITKVCVGDSQIWPPVQKVIYVGSMAASGNAPTFPTHQAGDLMVVAAQGSSSTSTPVPSLPAGWTQAYRSSSNQGCPVLIGYKFATASNTQGGTWASSAYTCGYVFRGADTTTPFGAFNSTMNAASTPEVTPVNTAGESVLVHYFYNNGTTGAWGASPVGLVNKNAVARLGNLLRLDTRIGAGAKWSHTASPVPNFRTVQFEVLPVATGPDTGVLTTKLVWVDSRAFYGGTQLTFGQHQAGDLLLVVAIGSVAPSAPYPYTLAYQSDASGSIAGTVAWKIAASGGEIAGTWNGVAGATTYVIRGCNQTTPLGDVQSIYQNTSTLVSNAPALTLTDPSGESLVAHSHYNNANTGSWNTGDPAGFITKTKQDRMTSIQQLNTTVGLPSSLKHSSAQKTLGFSVEVLAGSYSGGTTEEPLWLYDVDITYKGSLIVDFALKKGLGPYDPLDEGFMFRCAQFSNLDGYVSRNFTKTFPASAYSELDCTVEDMYGDGTANPDYLYKKISFKVTPRP